MYGEIVRVLGGIPSQMQDGRAGVLVLACLKDRASNA